VIFSKLFPIFAYLFSISGFLCWQMSKFSKQKQNHHSVNTKTRIERRYAMSGNSFEKITIQGLATEKSFANLRKANQIFCIE